MKSFKSAKTVAIDGPAGSGKSSVSKLLAEKLGVTYIDTGAMYRALTLKVMMEGLDLSNEKGIVKASSDFAVKLLPPKEGGGPVQVLLDGEDVTEKIREMTLTRNVKHIARIASVRSNMVELQRRMIHEMDGAVMEGRDIGTVVLVDAKHKFYLDASFDERVKRRLEELRAKGHGISRQEVVDDLKQRDHSDKTRETGPLKKAIDAHLIDTTALSVEEVVEKCLSIMSRG